MWDSVKDSLLQSWFDLKDNIGALKGMARCCISFLQVVDVYCVPTGVQTCVQACVYRHVCRICISFLSLWTGDWRAWRNPDGMASRLSDDPKNLQELETFINLQIPTSVIEYHCRTQGTALVGKKCLHSHLARFFCEDLV